MGDMYSGGRGGTNTIEVRDESSANSGVSEVSLYLIELALSVTFSSVKFNLLVFYHLKFALMCLIPVDVSDNTRVFEVYDGIVDEKLGSRERVEDIEIIILDPRTVKIWSGCVPVHEEEWSTWGYLICEPP